MSEPAPGARPYRRWLPILAVGVALFLAARLSGVLAPGQVADLVRAAGPWGAALYLGAFVLGELALVPGAIIIAAAGLVYGPVLGSALAFVGAIAASSTSFALARRAGLRIPSLQMPGLVERGLAHLERHPLSTVFLLRFIFAAYPPLSLALAASSIRTRDYLVGTVLGLVVPVVLVTSLAAHFAP